MSSPSPTGPFSEPLDYYLSLITSEYQASPNLLAWLGANLQLFQDTAACLLSMLSAFNLNTAVGVQLDTLGQIIGVGRTVDFTPTPVLTTQLISVGNQPSWLASDGTNVWVTNYADSTVTKILASTGAVLGTYSTGASTHPRGIVFDGTYLWTANTNGTLTQLNTSGSVVGTFTLNAGSAAWGITYDGTNIWVTDTGNSTVIKVLAGSVIGTYSVGTLPFGVCFDGTNIWTANQSSQNITKLLASSGALIGTYTVGGSSATAPYDLVSDGINIWVTDIGTDSIIKVLISSGATIATIPATGEATGIAYDGSANIYVAVSGPNIVLKIATATDFIVGTYNVNASVPIGLLLTGYGASIWTTDFSSAEVTKITPNTPVSPILDDTTYRLVLKAKVFQNHWNGQIDSFQAFWQLLFPGGQIAIDDGQNMSATVILSGLFTQIIVDLIEHGYIVPRSQAVQFSYTFPEFPMLGFDENTSLIAGLDLGKFT
jgi:streptogramin lyase